MDRVAGREVPGRSPRDAARPRRHRGLERPRPGPRVREGGERDRPRAHQARRHGQGRGGGGGGARARGADPLRRGGGDRSRTCCPSTRRPSPTAWSAPPNELQATWRAEDERWMRRALALAARGLGETNPNPVVGCVIVQERPGGRARATTRARAGPTPRWWPSRRRGPAGARRDALRDPRALRALRPHSAVRSARPRRRRAARGGGDARPQPARERQGPRRLLRRAGVAVTHRRARGRGRAPERALPRARRAKAAPSCC